MDYYEMYTKKDIDLLTYFMSLNEDDKDYDDCFNILVDKDNYGTVYAIDILNYGVNNKYKDICWSKILSKPYNCQKAFLELKKIPDSKRKKMLDIIFYSRHLAYFLSDFENHKNVKQEDKIYILEKLVNSNHYNTISEVMRSLDQFNNKYFKIFFFKVLSYNYDFLEKVNFQNKDYLKILHDAQAPAMWKVKHTKRFEDYTTKFINCLNYKEQEYLISKEMKNNNIALLKYYLSEKINFHIELKEKIKAYILLQNLNIKGV